MWSGYPSLELGEKNGARSGEIETDVHGLAVLYFLLKGSSFPIKILTDIFTQTNIYLKNADIFQKKSLSLLKLTVITVG